MSGPTTPAPYERGQKAFGGIIVYMEGDTLLIVAEHPLPAPHSWLNERPHAAN